MEKENKPTQEALDRERNELLSQYEAWTEWLGLILGLVWLVLLMVDFIGKRAPFFDAAFNLIWLLFILDFLIRFTLSPRKIQYLKHNWLTAISLLIPALQILRIAVLARFLSAGSSVQGLRMVRLVTSINRGMRSLSRVLTGAGSASSSS